MRRRDRPPRGLRSGTRGDDPRGEVHVHLGGAARGHRDDGHRPRRGTCLSHAAGGDRDPARLRRRADDVPARAGRDLFPAGLASAFFARYEGELQAAAIVVFHGFRATFLYGASRREHRRVMAPTHSTPRSWPRRSAEAARHMISTAWTPPGARTMPITGSRSSKEIRGRAAHLHRRTRLVRLRPRRRRHDPVLPPSCLRRGADVSPAGLILHTLMILAVGLVLFGLGHLLLTKLLPPRPGARRAF